MKRAETNMTHFRDHKNQRHAVLRPADPSLALRRLTEWNALMDKASDAVSPEQGKPFSREADALWIASKKEQAWTFVGWLGVDGKQVLDEKGEPAGDGAPGDLHEPEDRLKGWKR